MSMPEANAAEMAAFNAQNYGQQGHGLMVNFYEEAELDERATNGWTEERYDIDTGEKRVFKHPGAGRPIYKQVEYVEIRIPGNMREIRRRPVRQSDIERFPREYEAFKRSQSQVVNGTPLDKLPFLTKAQVLEFQAAGLLTAENIRDMSDVDAQRFMGLSNVRKRVVDYLAAIEGNVPVARLQSELEQRDSEIAALRAQMGELAKSVETTREKKARGA